MAEEIQPMEEEWDNLIILDACRYDYFERICDNYLSGNLKKVISPGSGTSEWLRRVFDNKKFDDIVYVSANPFINPRGSNLVEGFNGRECFYKVIDVWDRGWDDESKTVPPEKVSKEARMARARYPNKRLIIHFMQPHQPYLSLGPIRKGFESAAVRAKYSSYKVRIKRDLVGKIRKSIGSIVESFLGSLGRRKAYRIKRALNLRPPEESELVAQKYGKNVLRNAYMENLRIVLEEVVELLERIPNEKSVITLDHGELLGEDGFYSHQIDHPLLREVPWLKVEKES